ncbi:LRR receptor-like serine/threonine-protein kinase GSO1 isoform X2 [Arachis ipaensis]|uniref:LRR receptor-like serine/threonine-protein kinase GSO1 isoform X2 n=1 Tax=Arachis ipaensis TaxID=130454 RepID=UPI0007AF26B9|nr:LRR receptor-like serine/threonine-protein kinase GSO1 isoform X2 [Arachis ipaensis]
MNSFHFLLLLSFFQFLALLISPKLVHGNAELRALMDLKSSLDPEGKVLGSWRSDGDPCTDSFLGVACNQHRKVANISLAGRGLSGMVSPSVAELKCLSGLYLHYNIIFGEIPIEISNLTELVDLYLNVNNLSGSIPKEIGKMTSLQVLQLGFNQLVGSIPKEIGSLKQLNVLALQHNRLTGMIPPSLGNLEMLRRLNLSFNNLNGVIPATLADIAHLEVLDVQNNSLSGVVPSALRKLDKGFQYANNQGLCAMGFRFPTLRACNKDSIYDSQISVPNIPINSSYPKAFPDSATIKFHCNQTQCSKSRRFPQAVIAASVITATITLIGSGFVTFVRYRRRKQRILHTSDSSVSQLSPVQPMVYTRSPSPLVNLEYYNNGLDPLADGKNCSGLSHEYLNKFRFNVDEIESATQYLSEANLLGKSKFSAVYKGVLRDGSPVAIRSINVTCCIPEEVEFLKGLSLLTSLRHENIVKMRGFCCSSSRGLGYLHSNEASKPTIVHQNISVEKVLLDNQFNPLIMDAGLPKLLADDIVFSALKVSAAMGYLAPEYITTGRFTEKSDVYAFGVIVLQVLSGKTTVGCSIRMAVESFRFDDFVDTNLKGKYSKAEAAILSKIAVMCTHELSEQRPNMVEVIRELSMYSSYSS